MVTAYTTVNNNTPILNGIEFYSVTQKENTCCVYVDIYGAYIRAGTVPFKIWLGTNRVVLLTYSSGKPPQMRNTNSFARKSSGQPEFLRGASGDSVYNCKQQYTDSKSLCILVGYAEREHMLCICRYLYGAYISTGTVPFKIWLGTNRVELRCRTVAENNLKCAIQTRAHENLMGSVNFFVVPVVTACTTVNNNTLIPNHFAL